MIISFIIFALFFILLFVVLSPMPMNERFCFSFLIALSAVIKIRGITFQNLIDSFNQKSDPMTRTKGFQKRTEEMEEMRLIALAHARPFLSPFNNIWQDLRLSNKYCSLALSKNGKSISGIEKIDDNAQNSRTFFITKSDDYSFDELWNRFCTEFNHATTYDALVRLSKICQTDIKEASSKNTTKEIKSPKKAEVLKKIDINNCSEIEMTGLPGINIVAAKRAIKKREEIGGFKTIDDFFKFLNVKQRMKEQLQGLICANKMQGNIEIKKSQERTLDL